MKNILILLGFGLATALFSSEVIAQKTPETKESKNSRHVKMIKVENGKKIVLDTVLTNNDVFVWKGDTLNPAKRFKKINPSGFDQMHEVDVKVDNKDGKKNIVIHRSTGGQKGEPIIWRMDTGNKVEVYTTEEGDSLHEKIIIRKGKKDEKDEDSFILLNNLKGKHFPPTPPNPPVPPHFKILKGQNAGRVIDLNDPNIISYKKKKLNGDREKIEIIRKISEDQENTTFDFKVDNKFMNPEKLERIREIEGRNQKMEIIEKEIKVDDKKGKDTNMEVKTNNK